MRCNWWLTRCLGFMLCFSVASACSENRKFRRARRSGEGARKKSVNARGSLLPHTHAKSAFIYAYVISGAIESKVNDGETRIYRAGERWSEPPGAIHSISRNASKTEPAKLLAVFVLDTNDNPLTTPIK